MHEHDDHAPDDPLSTLYAFWTETEAPLEEEVHLSVEQAFPGAAVVDELEADGDFLWGRVWRLPEHDAEFIVWAEPRGTMSDEAMREALTDDREFNAARRARWLVGVETLLDPGAATAAFQTQVRLLEACAVPGLVAAYDDNALVVRSGQQLRELARSHAAPRPATLYAVHELEGDDTFWLHTHGLARLGLPEIELLGVPPAGVADGYDLIDAIVDVIIGGAEPEATGVLPVGEDLEVRLVPPADAFARLDAAIVAVREVDDGDDEDHRDPRVVVLARDRDEPPFEVLDSLAAGAVLFKSREEGERQRQLAVERFGVFGQLFAMRRRDGWRFHAKLAFERGAGERGVAERAGGDRSGGRAAREHVWFEVRDLRPGGIFGRCLNDPGTGLGVHHGDEGWFGLDRLTDWLIVAPEGTFDPEGAAVLLGDS